MQSDLPPTPPDEPMELDQDEAREELLGSETTPGRRRLNDLLLILVAIVLAAVALDRIEHWSEWLVLGAILFTLVGAMIAVSPNRPRA
jgi:ferric-dicitrate binding protein FerR (iron transport regulator)